MEPTFWQEETDNKQSKYIYGMLYGDNGIAEKEGRDVGGLGILQR